MNIVEYMRKLAIENLFKTETFSKSFETWKEVISRYIENKNFFELGDKISEIFMMTNDKSRSQSSVSGAGNSWESLVCWYLNLLLIEQNTVVIKQNKGLIPRAVRDAISVNYGSFVSNTEADLIAITFPNEINFKCDIKNIKVSNNDNICVENFKNNKELNFLEIIDSLTEKNFEKISIHIIQCKTNWNDNAQIPMLWNMIYSASNLINNGQSILTVGRNGFNLQNCKKFTYSFVTVPTVKLDKFKVDSIAVKRVANMTGGNYWGYQSKDGIARNIKEIVYTNFVENNNIREKLKEIFPYLKTKYSYFGV